MVSVGTVTPSENKQTCTDKHRRPWGFHCHDSTMHDGHVLKRLEKLYSSFSAAVSALGRQNLCEPIQNVTFRVFTKYG